MAEITVICGLEILVIKINLALCNSIMEHCESAAVNASTASLCKYLIGLHNPSTELANRSTVTQLSLSVYNYFLLFLDALYMCILWKSPLWH